MYSLNKMMALPHLTRDRNSTGKISSKAQGFKCKLTVEDLGKVGFRAFASII